MSWRWTFSTAGVHNKLVYLTLFFELRQGSGSGGPSFAICPHDFAISGSHELEQWPLFLV